MLVLPSSAAAASSLVRVRGLAGALGYADCLDHVLDFSRWRGRKTADHEGDGEVDQHADKANAFRRNAEPIFFAIRKELEINDISEGETDPRNHSRNGSLFVYFFGENPHDEGRKE